MPDRQKSNLPPPPGVPAPSRDDNPTFRETFLLHLPPELHAGVRETGRAIFATALEMEPPPLPRAWTHRRRRAVAADLRFLRLFLGAIGEDRFKASLAK